MKSKTRYKSQVTTSSALARGSHVTPLPACVNISALYTAASTAMWEVHICTYFQKARVNSRWLSSKLQISNPLCLLCLNFNFFRNGTPYKSLRCLCLLNIFTSLSNNIPAFSTDVYPVRVTIAQKQSQSGSLIIMLTECLLIQLNTQDDCKSPVFLNSVGGNWSKWRIATEGAWIVFKPMTQFLHPKISNHLPPTHHGGRDGGGARAYRRYHRAQGTQDPVLVYHKAQKCQFTHT